jgi:hypothetical protein
MEFRKKVLAYASTATSSGKLEEVNSAYVEVSDIWASKLQLNHVCVKVNTVSAGI